MGGDLPRPKRRCSWRGRCAHGPSRRTNAVAPRRLRTRGRLADDRVRHLDTAEALWAQSQATIRRISPERNRTGLFPVICPPISGPALRDWRQSEGREDWMPHASPRPAMSRKRRCIGGFARIVSTVANSRARRVLKPLSCARRGGGSGSSCPSSRRCGGVRVVRRGSGGAPKSAVRHRGEIGS